jgi:hypothetical protein
MADDTTHAIPKALWIASNGIDSDTHFATLLATCQQIVDTYNAANPTAMATTDIADVYYDGDPTLGYQYSGG